MTSDFRSGEIWHTTSGLQIKRTTTSTVEPRMSLPGQKIDALSLQHKHDRTSEQFSTVRASSTRNPIKDEISTRTPTRPQRTGPSLPDGRTTTLTDLQKGTHSWRQHEWKEPLVNERASTKRNVFSLSTTPTPQQSKVNANENHASLFGIVGGLVGILIVLVCFAAFLYVRANCPHKQTVSDHVDPLGVSVIRTQFPLNSDIPMHSTTVPYEVL